MLDIGIRILIADDHRLVRQALGALLIGEDVEIVGEADNGLEAVELVRSTNPDVVLMDVAMPTLDGVEAIRRIKRLAPKVRVLVLTSTASERQAAAALAAGAAGCALKLLGHSELMEAITQVRAGKTYLAPGLDSAKVWELVAGHDDRTALTARERQVVQLIAGGRSSREIADQLGVAFKTADAHRTNAMQKLGIHNSAELAAYAIRHGLIV